MHDAAPSEILKTVVALEQLHHDWYFETKETTNFVRYVEWLMERTTCIQKELVKWLASFPPSTALTWGFRHILEEVSLLESDLSDTARLVNAYSPSDERMLPNSQPSLRVLDMVQRMFQMSADIREAMRQWGEEHASDPSAKTVVALSTNVCAVQSALLRAVEDNPKNIRVALTAACPDMTLASATLRGIIRSVFPTREADE